MYQEKHIFVLWKAVICLIRLHKDCTYSYSVYSFIFVLRKVFGTNKKNTHTKNKKKTFFLFNFLPHKAGNSSCLK